MGALNDIRARAMDILARYKDVIDAADSSTGEKDGRFNVISFRNIANSPELPQDLRDAANLVADDEAMIRDIDGSVGDNGIFEWSEFEQAHGHTRDPKYEWKGYEGAPRPKVTAIDDPTQQTSLGNCVMISVVTSLAATDEGRDILKRSIKKYSDGTYGVIFAGDPAQKEYKVKLGPESARFGTGDEEMLVLNDAADQYRKEREGLEQGIEFWYSEGAFNLLTGDKGWSGSLRGSGAAEQIEKWLYENAPRIGKDLALTLSGRARKDGTLTFETGNHTVSVKSIDTVNGTLTYVNPWDTSKEITISIKDMVREMAAGDGRAGIEYEFFGADVAPGALNQISEMEVPVGGVVVEERRGGGA